MKTTLKYFCMAAILVAVATIAGCTKEENNGDGQTLTTSVSLPDNDAKALDEHGVKTFAVGDQIMMTYTRNGSTINKTSRPLNAGDISANGKVANFSFTITGNLPGRNTTVTFLYPANDSNTPPITTGQDGTLTTLASTYDIATCETLFPGNNRLPANIQLTNRCAILKLKFKNSAGTDITTSLTGLTVRVGTDDTYTITPTGSTFASSPIYVAILIMPRSSITQDITFTATGSNSVTYTKIATNRTLRSGYLYPVEVEMTAPMCTYYPPTLNNSVHSYNGSPQSLLITHNATHATVYYRYDYESYIGTSSSSEWSTTAPTGTNAGHYTLYYKVVPASGYDGGVEETLIGTKTIGRVSWTGYVIKLNEVDGTLTYTYGQYCYDGNYSLSTGDGSSITYQWEYLDNNGNWNSKNGSRLRSERDFYARQWRVTYGGDLNHNPTTFTSPL